MFVIFLGIDPDLVTTLADSVWQVNTVNTGIVEDYIHHIYHLPMVCQYKSLHFQLKMKLESKEMLYGFCMVF